MADTRSQLTASPSKSPAARQGSAVLRASFFERLLEGHVELCLGFQGMIDPEKGSSWGELWIIHDNGRTATAAVPMFCNFNGAMTIF